MLKAPKSEFSADRAQQSRQQKYRPVGGTSAPNLSKEVDLTMF